MHSDIVTFQHNNQLVTTTHEISRVTGITHSNILQVLYVQKRYYDELGHSDRFERDFIRADVKVLKLTSQLNCNLPKRGRPSVVYLLTQEGALSFVGALSGKKACEFRIAVANAFVQMERTIKTIIPQLQAENERLRLENERLISNRKQITGPRKGYIRTPHFQINLWGEKDAIYYEMRPKHELDDQMKALAYLDLYDNMQRGIDEKRSIQIEIITKETLRDRVEVQHLAQRRFALPAETKKIKKGQSNE